MIDNYHIMIQFYLNNFTKIIIGIIVVAQNINNMTWKETLIYVIFDSQTGKHLSAQLRNSTS